MTKTTRSELLDLIYRFYPRGVHCFDRIHVPPGEPFYDDTEEHRRLVEASPGPRPIPKRRRGPITRDTHARLVAASERAARDELLKTLALPRSALMPLERVLLARSFSA